MLKRGKSNAMGPLASMPRPDEIPMATANDQCSGRIVGHHRSKSVGSPERKSPIAKMSSDNVVQKHKGASGVPVRPTTAVKKQLDMASDPQIATRGRRIREPSRYVKKMVPMVRHAEPIRLANSVRPAREKLSN